MPVIVKTNKEKPKSAIKFNKDCFESSLRPLIIFFLFYGIRLDVSERRQLKSKLIIAVLGLSLIVLNLFFNGVTFWKTFSKHAVYGKIHVTNPKRKEDAPNIINSLIGIFICTFFPIGTHIIFVFKMRKPWHFIWENLIEIQSEMKIGNFFYKKCKTYCWIFLFLLFAV